MLGHVRQAREDAHDLVRNDGLTIDHRDGVVGVVRCIPPSRKREILAGEQTGAGPALREFPGLPVVTTCDDDQQWLPTLPRPSPLWPADPVRDAPRARLKTSPKRILP